MPTNDSDQSAATGQLDHAAGRNRRSIASVCSATTSLSDASLTLIVAKHADDVSGKAFLDLSVTRNRLRDARAGVAIPIVLCSMPNERTTESFDHLDKIDPFHDTTRSSTRRAPGTNPADRSA